MNYRSLKITNFRAVNSLEAEDFKQVNFLKSLPVLKAMPDLLQANQNTAQY
jgi:hypothetical protein